MATNDRTVLYRAIVDLSQLKRAAAEQKALEEESAARRKARNDAEIKAAGKDEERIKALKQRHAQVERDLARDIKKRGESEERAAKNISKLREQATKLRPKVDERGKRELDLLELQLTRLNRKRVSPNVSLDEMLALEAETLKAKRTIDKLNDTVKVKVDVVKGKQERVSDFKEAVRVTIEVSKEELEKFRKELELHAKDIPVPPEEAQQVARDKAEADRTRARAQEKNADTSARRHEEQRIQNARVRAKDEERKAEKERQKAEAAADRERATPFRGELRQDVSRARQTVADLHQDQRTTHAQRGRLTELDELLGQQHRKLEVEMSWKDTERVQERINKLNTSIRAIQERIEIRVVEDDAKALEKVEKLKGSLEELKQKARDTRLAPAMDDRAKHEVDALLIQMDRLDRKASNPRITLDGAIEVEAQILRVRRALANLEERRTIRVAARTEEAATQVDKLKLAIEELTARTPAIRLKANSAFAKKSIDEIRLKLLRLSSVVASPRISLHGAAKAEAEILLLRKELNKLEKETTTSNKLGRVFTSMADALAGAGTSLLGAAGGLHFRAQLILGLVSVLSPLIAILGAATGAVIGFGNALASLSGLAATLPGLMFAFGTSIGALFVALKPMVTVFKAFSKLQKDSADNGEAAAASVDKLKSAEETNAAAVKAVIKAQEGLNDARKQAKQDLEDLRKEVERASLSEEGARAAVMQAEDAYRASLIDSNQSDADRATKLYELHKAYADLDDVKQTNTRNAVKLNEAEKKGIEGSDKVVQARETLTSAQVAAAKSTRELHKAQAEVKAGSSVLVKDQEAINRALSKLSPSAKSVVLQLWAMRDAFKDLSKNVQESFFAPIVNQVKDLKPLLPVITTLLTDAAGAIGRVTSNAFTMIGAWAKSGDLGFLSKENVFIIETLGNALLDVANAFKDIAVAAAPFTRLIVGAVGKGARAFADLVSNARKTGQLANWLKLVYDRTVKWWTILTNLVAVFFNFGKAASDFGTDTLNWLEKVTGGWKAFSEEQTKAGSPFKKYLEAIKPTLTEFGNLVKALSDAIVKIAIDPVNLQAGVDLLVSLRKDVLPALVNLLNALGNEGIGIAILKALSVVVQGIADLIKHGALTTILAFLATFQALTKIVAVVLNWGPLPTIIGLIGKAFGIVLATFAVARLVGFLLFIKQMRWLVANRANLGRALAFKATGGAFGTSTAALNTPEGIAATELKGSAGELSGAAGALRAAAGALEGAAGAEEGAAATEETAAGRNVIPPVIPGGRGVPPVVPTSRTGFWRRDVRNPLGYGPGTTGYGEQGPAGYVGRHGVKQRPTDYVSRHAGPESEGFVGSRRAADAEREARNAARITEQAAKDAARITTGEAARASLNSRIMADTAGARFRGAVGSATLGMRSSLGSAAESIRGAGLGMRTSVARAGLAIREASVGFAGRVTGAASVAAARLEAGAIAAGERIAAAGLLAERGGLAKQGIFGLGKAGTIGLFAALGAAAALAFTRAYEAIKGPETVTRANQATLQDKLLTGARTGQVDQGTAGQFSTGANSIRTKYGYDAAQLIAKGERLTGRDDNKGSASEQLRNLEDLDKALADLVKHGHAKEAQKAIEQLGYESGQTGAIMPIFTKALDESNKKLGDAHLATQKAGFADLDKQLAILVKSGNMDKAKDILKQYGLNIESAAAVLPQFTAAQKGYNDELARMTPFLQYLDKRVVAQQTGVGEGIYKDLKGAKETLSDPFLQKYLSKDFRRTLEIKVDVDTAKLQLLDSNRTLDAIIHGKITGTDAIKALTTNLGTLDQAISTIQDKLKDKSLTKLQRDELTGQLTTLKGQRGRVKGTLDKETRVLTAEADVQGIDAQIAILQEELRKGGLDKPAEKGINLKLRELEKQKGTAVGIINSIKGKSVTLSVSMQGLSDKDKESLKQTGVYESAIGYIGAMRAKKPPVAQSWAQAIEWAASKAKPTTESANAAEHRITTSHTGSANAAEASHVTPAKAPAVPREYKNAWDRFWNAPWGKYATGGSLREGISTVGELGPELAIKSGSNVQIIPNKDIAGYWQGTDAGPSFDFGISALRTSVSKVPPAAKMSIANGGNTVHNNTKGDTNINLTVNNPKPEPASDSLSRQLQKARFYGGAG